MSHERLFGGLLAYNLFCFVRCPPFEPDACPLDYCVTLPLRNPLPLDPQSR